MENIIMLSHNRSEGRNRLGRMLGLGLGLAVALLANFGDRAFLASSDNSGIDPLQILDTEVKNNILFMVSTSETLAGTAETAATPMGVGGDDPASRLYQVKRALRDLIAENQGKANFGVATFHPEAAEHVINDSNGLVYVTQDPTGNNYRNEFDRSGGSNIAIAPGVQQTFGGSPFTTTGYTPAANALLIAFVTSASGSDPTTVTGHGLAYTKYTNVAVGGQAMSVWAANSGAAPTSAGVSASGSISRPVTISEVVVTGADLSGSLLDVFVQKAATSATGTSASTTLGAPSDPRNAAMYYVVHAARTFTTPAPGWTEVSDSGAAHTGGAPANDAGVEVQYRLAFSTTAGATFTSSAWTGLAFEIKSLPIPPLIDACGGGCTPTESSTIFDLFRSNDPATASKYPAVCTDQLLDQVDTAGNPVAPITHTLNTNCRYYVRSKILLSGKLYVVDRAAAASSAIIKTADITCPPPPPGLLGDDTLAANDGTRNRACFQLLDSATSRITTYWLTGAQFDYSPVTPPPSLPRPAFESGINVDIAECEGADNTAALQVLNRMELQYDGSGLPLGVPPLTAVGGLRPQDPTYIDVGIRLGTGSPITNSLRVALDYFRQNVLPAGGTAKRPQAAQGKQKQFVVLIVDANDPFNTLAEAKQAAYNLWRNTSPALPTCTANCGTLGDVTAAGWATANRIELIVVPFGVPGATMTQADMDAISAAGSGQNPLNAACDPDGTCRSAPIANTYDELLTALRTAVFSGSGTGTFSDQQSVTETLFEFASLATPSKDPLDPYERYAVAIPVLLQSTFELPDFKGHLNAVRRNNAGTPNDPDDDFQQVEWDAGSKLYQRVSSTSSPSNTLPTTGLGTMVPGTGYSFTQLYGNANPPSVPVKGSTALIKRRIFTTVRNGVNANYNVNYLLAGSAGYAALAGPTGGFRRAPLWPPSPTGAADNTFVAPTATGTTLAPIHGILDSAMGLVDSLTFAQVQALVPGACEGTPLHAECTTAPKPRVRREAREIVLAYLAGARVKTLNGVPSRNLTTRELQYDVRPWIMVESTLASPGVVTPPLLAGPKTGELGADEYTHYRDGLRTPGTFVPINGVLNGVGLRNPDRVDAAAAQSVKDAAASDLALKPSMSVVYHSTNQGLHAFRAGPCPVPKAGSGISALTIPCAGETGGEEMWAFVPHDLLHKLPALIKPQTRATKQYLLASPVRFADVFVPGSGTFNGTSFAGVWRVLLYFGRGEGGKHYTALDVTTPGPFTRHSLETTDPIVVWSRGNPDTTLGVPCASGVPNNDSSDCAKYEKMGETWSVPALGYVDEAAYGGANFALFTGSGYSDVVGEGKTFFVLNALNGNVIQDFDIWDNGSVPAQTPPLTNFLVASPVGYAEDADGNSPSGYNFLGNPIATKTTKVYFPDLHGRIWRYDATSPGDKPQIFYEADVATLGNQPFAVPVSVQQNRPDPAVPGDILVYAEAGHDRRVALDPSKPFKAFALKDNNTPGEVVFIRDLVNDLKEGYRGTTQPASAFAGAAPPTPVTFFAGIKFNAGCVPTFDSILFALKGQLPKDNPQGDAAFDLSVIGDDAYIEIQGSKIQAIRVSGEGSLVIDQGLSAQNVPPPPGVPVPAVPIPGSSGLVRMGLTPGTQDYKDLAATTQPYRIGSAVCRVQ